MITGVSNTRNILLPNIRKVENSRVVCTADVFIRVNKTNEDINFKGSEEAGKIFKELIKEHPDKAEILKNLQSFTEVVPYGDFPIWLAGTAHKVLKGDFTEAGVKSLLYAADNTVLLPAKTAFVTAMGAKGAAVGTVAPGVGNIAGGIIGAGGALLAWAGIRGKIGDEITRLIEEDNDDSEGSSSDDDGGYKTEEELQEIWEKTHYWDTM